MRILRCPQNGQGIGFAGSGCGAGLPEEKQPETGKLRGRASGAENA